MCWYQAFVLWLPLMICHCYIVWIFSCMKNPGFGCRRCLRNARPIDGKPCVNDQLADGKLDVVDNFVYLLDRICAGGGCELATIKRYRPALGKFTKLFPFKQVVKCITAVPEAQCFIHLNIGPSDTHDWRAVKEQCSYGFATSRKNNVSAQILF